MALHKKLAESSSLKTCVADPHSPLAARHQREHHPDRRLHAPGRAAHVLIEEVVVNDDVLEQPTSEPAKIIPSAKA